MFLESTRITIYPTGRRAWNTCIARAIGERKWKTTRVIENRTDLPTSDDLIHNSVCMGEQQLISTERQLSQAVDDDLLLSDKTVATLCCPWIPGVKATLPRGTPLPRIIRIQRISVGELLCQSYL